MQRKYLCSALFWGLIFISVAAMMPPARPCAIPGVKIFAKAQDEAQKMAQEGWKAWPGFPSIENQLDSFNRAANQLDTLNAPVWLIVTGTGAALAGTNATQGAMDSAWRNLVDQLEVYLERNHKTLPNLSGGSNVTMHELYPKQANTANAPDTISSKTIKTFRESKLGVKMEGDQSYEITYDNFDGNCPYSKLVIHKLYKTFSTTVIHLNALKTFVKVSRKVGAETEVLVKLGYNLQLVSNETMEPQKKYGLIDSSGRKKFEKYLEEDMK